MTAIVILKSYFLLQGIISLVMVIGIEMIEHKIWPFI